MEITDVATITGDEISRAEECMEAAKRAGADQVRVSLNKSTLDSYGMLNGSLDKVAHSADRSIMLYVFADRKYGTFSTNMLENGALEDFACKAVKTVRMLAEDVCRRLPDPGRTEKGALTGTELGLCDRDYFVSDPERKYGTACGECISGRAGLGPDDVSGNGRISAAGSGTDGFRIISEECEYSDSVDDNFTIDSSGFRGRHTETSFAICSEITVEASDGRKYSGYWWDSSPFFNGLALGQCSGLALERAVRQINPKRHRGGRFRMVVDRTVASRLVSPLFSALNATSIQQESSFLKDSLHRKVFPDGLTITDMARTPGKPGSRLFDSEGVATREMDIIRNGEIDTYFTNTYMSLKTGLEATVEGVSRPVLLPFVPDGAGFRSPQPSAGGSGVPGNGFGAAGIMELCGSGIYVTGFNGGNCNPVTGNFSYGIEGFAFRNGQITHPVREMVVTGNMISLWNSLLYAGNDARECTRWQIPTLAFENAVFSA